MAASADLSAALLEVSTLAWDLSVVVAGLSLAIVQSQSESLSERISIPAQSLSERASIPDHKSELNPIPWHSQSETIPLIPIPDRISISSLAVG
jgi:hypothetical protein